MIDELHHILHFIFVLNLALSVGLVAILVALLRFGRLIVLRVFLTLSFLLRLLHHHVPNFGAHHDQLQLLLGDPFGRVRLVVRLKLAVKHVRNILGRWMDNWHLSDWLWLCRGHKP